MIDLKRAKTGKVNCEFCSSTKLEKYETNMKSFYYCRDCNIWYTLQAEFTNFHFLLNKARNKIDKKKYKDSVDKKVFKIGARTYFRKTEEALKYLKDDKKIYYDNYFNAYYLKKVPFLF